MLAFLIFKLTLSFGLRTININSGEPTSNYLKDNVNQTIIVNEHRELGNCACDVTNQCDPYCCCDPDCPDKIKEDFEISGKCLPDLTNFKVSEKKALRKCSDPEIEGDGSLLDWIQRTMLCISRDNNPSVGKFFVPKSDSDTKFVDTQSSLSNSFQPVHETEEILRPLISIININNIRDEETDESLSFYLSKLCNFYYKASYPCPNEYYFNGSLCINEFNKSTRNSYICIDDHYDFFNGTHCVDIESTNSSEESSYEFLCNGNLTFNGTYCIDEDNGYSINPNICPESYYYNHTENLCRNQFNNSKIINLTMSTYCYDDGCYLKQSLNQYTTLYQENQDNILHTCKKDGISQTENHNTLININITNIKCIDSKNCTAKFENETDSEETDSKETIEPQSLEDINQISNTTISIKLYWPIREGVIPQPRGYYFTEELKDETGNTIEIDAPSQSNACNNKTPLRFGMNVDFTCMTELEITNFNLTNSTLLNSTEENCDFSEFVNPNITSIRQVPFHSPGDDNYAINIDDEEFCLDFKQIVENSSIQETPDGFENFTVDSLFITEISRSINIFYKTVGYEKSPTHIIMSANVEYDYSTSVKFLNSNFAPNYKNVSLRTIVRFFEYPNNVNMFKGSSNTKVQSWLPFDV